MCRSIVNVCGFKSSLGCFCNTFRMNGRGAFLTIVRVNDRILYHKCDVITTRSLSRGGTNYQCVLLPEVRISLERRTSKTQ